MIYMPRLDDGDGVLVYCASYDEIEDRENAPGSLLGHEELERAQRFVFEEDRRRFILSHAFMRRVLEIHTQLPAAAIPLHTVENEPPALVQRGHFPPLYLSLSHCRSHAAVAISPTPGIGVDVEHASSARGGAEIVKTFFSPQEKIALSGMNPAQFDDAFLQMWTSKEAFSKAVGVGLAIPLEMIVVTAGSSRCRISFSNLDFEARIIRVEHFSRNPAVLSVVSVMI